MENPTDSFKITYPHFGGVGLFFEDFHSDTGCKTITLFSRKGSAWRIWVSDQDGNDRDIDTLKYVETNKRLCSKWIHIHIKKDGGLYT